MYKIICENVTLVSKLLDTLCMNFFIYFNCFNLTSFVIYTDLNILKINLSMDSNAI